jgi:hypothetical protein
MLSTYRIDAGLAAALKLPSASIGQSASIGRPRPLPHKRKIKNPASPT